jgi:hypothetical protein
MVDPFQLQLMKLWWKLIMNLFIILFGTLPVYNEPVSQNIEEIVIFIAPTNWKL